MILALDDKKTSPFGDVRSPQPINAVFSPDGKWVAYTVRAPTGQIYVQPFPATGVPYQVTKVTDTSAHHPFWSRNGSELYYVPGPGQFAYISVTTRPTFAFKDPAQLSRGPNGFIEGGPTNRRQTDATSDGRVVTIVAGNPMTAQEASGADSQAARFHVVLNWLEELKARAPVK